MIGQLFRVFVERYRTPLNYMENSMSEHEHIKPAFYRITQMVALTGLGKTTIYRKSQNDPDFPKPVKISDNATGWRAEEVESWIKARERVTLKGAF